MLRRAIEAYHVDWSLSALLLVQAVTIFVAIPLGTIYPTAHALLDVCRVTFALVAIASFARHRVLQVLLLVALVILTTGPMLGREMLDRLGMETANLQRDLIEATAFAFNLAVTALVARHIFGPGRVTAHRIQGAVLVYLNLAALFAIAYGVVVVHWPGAIILTTGHDIETGWGARTATLAYFSLTTITTTGFGDLVPVHPLARSLANLESVIGQLFPATLLARIVALHIEHGRDDRAA